MIEHDRTDDGRSSGFFVLFILSMIAVFVLLKFAIEVIVLADRQETESFFSLTFWL